MEGKEMLLVSSKTKEAMKSKGQNVSKEALEELNNQVHKLISDAQKRCENNGRKTLKPQDF